MKRWIATVPLILLLGGCSATQAAFTGGRTAAESANDIAQLKQRILELQRRAAVTDVELERLRHQVASLETRLTGTNPPSLPSGRLRPTNPPVEVAEPVANDGRPRLESPSGIPQPIEVIEEGELELDDPVPTSIAARDRNFPPASTAPASTDPTSGPAPMITADQPITAAAQALYDRGYTLYHQGKYIDAESAFQRFMQTYPRTELADNALYWIGESRLGRGDVRGALSAFRQAVESYPDGNKIPDSLLEAAQAMDSLGDQDGARRVYGEVIRRFPASAAAAVAEERRRAVQ